MLGSEAVCRRAGRSGQAIRLGSLEKRSQMGSLELQNHRNMLEHAVRCSVVLDPDTGGVKREGVFRCLLEGLLSPFGSENRSRSLPW